jgi:hypothetical protein
MLGQLALVKGTSEGKLVDLLEALPPAVIREALLVIVSTRPIALTEEFSSSTLLGEAWLRGLSSRLFVLDATRGDLDAYIDPPTGSLAADPAANRRNTRNKLSLYVLPEDGSTR